VLVGVQEQVVGEAVVPDDRTGPGTAMTAGLVQDLRAGEAGDQRAGLRDRGSEAVGEEGDRVA
jgi:hypothetical protein